MIYTITRSNNEGKAMNRLTVFVSVVLGLVPIYCTAEPYPKSIDLHINDFAQVIDNETETTTRVALSALLTETGIEMTVVTIPSRRDYDPSTSLETFSRGLFNDWGVGNGDNNDGILILVVTADQETRIELGSAYDQAYDVIAQDIISSDMVPEFREKRFAEGIENGVIETISRIALRLATTTPGGTHPAAGTGLFERLDGWIFGALFLGIAAYGIFGRRAGDALIRFRRCPGCGRRGLLRSHTHRPGPDDATPGMIGTSVTCRHCDYRDDHERRVMRRQDEKRSRDFGGGRSSGGGASGRW